MVFISRAVPMPRLIRQADNKGYRFTQCFLLKYSSNFIDQMAQLVDEHFHYYTNMVLRKPRELDSSWFNNLHRFK